MPNYKIVNTDQLDADLKAVADSIREKSGKSGSLAFPSGFVSAVDGIETGGGGGGVETCMVHVRFNMNNDYGYPLYIEYSTIENGKPVRGTFAFAGEFDDIIGEYHYPSQREYDFEVLSGSYMIIYDSDWYGVAVTGDIYNTNVFGVVALAFVPSDKTNANITLTY